MRKIKNRSHLRWLVPLFIFFVLLGFFLFEYKKEIHERAITAKETEMVLAIEQELQVIDISLANASSCLLASSNAISEYHLQYNRNQILDILNNIVSSTDATKAMICGLDGLGYDNEDWDVYLADETYFEEILSEYSKGGLGMVLPDDYGEGDDKEVLLVCHVAFEKKEDGVIVVKVPVMSLSDSLFMDRFMADNFAVITLDGIVLATTRGQHENVSEGRTSFWNQLPIGISKDTIKLNISQKNVYMGRIKDYGYILVIPMRVPAGGAVVLIRDDQMEIMIATEELDFRDLLVKIGVLIAALLLMVLFAHVISDLIEVKIREKKLSQNETDPVTGLITRTAAEAEIQNYMDNPDNKGGLLFFVGIEGVSTVTDLDRAIIDSRRKEFAKTLSKNFRATDILARIGDDRYLVFLKGVHEDKDVRKQTDEMQMFLHDLRVDTSEIGYAHAGAALFPENGKDVKELMESCEEALERSKEVGRGKLSF